MSTTALNGRKAESPTWYTLSVRNFFEQISWTGASASQATASLSSHTTALDEAVGLSLRLQVNDFFNRFPWEGQPHIATPISPVGVQAESSAADSITLDGFADLF